MTLMQKWECAENRVHRLLDRLEHCATQAKTDALNAKINEANIEAKNLYNLLQEKTNGRKQI